MGTRDLTPTAKTTIAVLDELRMEAFSGQLTTSQLIAKVKARYSQAPARSILLNLEKYGPIGDGSTDGTCIAGECGDVAWLRQKELTSRWYNPRTGELE